MIPPNLIRFLQILDNDDCELDIAHFPVPLTLLGIGAYRRVYKIGDTNYVLKQGRGAPTVKIYSRSKRKQWNKLVSHGCGHSGGFVSNINEFVTYKFKRGYFEDLGITLAKSYWISKRGRFLISEFVEGRNPFEIELSHYLGCGCDDEDYECDEEDERDEYGFGIKADHFNYEKYNERYDALDDAHYKNWILTTKNKFVLIDYGGCSQTNNASYLKHPFKELKNENVCYS